MKTFSKIFTGILGAVVALTTLNACEDYDTPVLQAPVATMKANTTIMELKQTFWSDDNNYIWNTPNSPDSVPCPIPTRPDGSHYIIKGTVISSDEAGNIFRSLIIQDETAALAMSIYSYNLYLKYRPGQEIVLDVTGMYLGKFNGLLQLGAPSWYTEGAVWEASFMAPEFFQGHVEVNGWPTVNAIDTISVNSFSELNSDPEGLMYWQSRLVRFNNVSFVNGGTATYSAYHENVDEPLVDSDGNTINVRTSGYSNFWNETLPQGKFDLVAIASYYGAKGWQLLMIDAAGAMNVGTPTTAPGSESNPFSVDEAIRLVDAGQTPDGWVTGYVVGAVAPEVSNVTSNSDIEWTSTPILGNTIVIGQTPDTKDIANALVMELPAGSALYAQANLVDNPDVYGKQIWIRGTMSTYLGTYGILGNMGTAGSYKIEGQIIDDNGPGPDGVYSVAAALKAINTGNIPAGNVQVRGVISEITEVSTSFGNATYIIKDNLSDAAGLTIYRGYYLNGDKFTSENQLQVGATVVVEGELIMYGGNKPEMSQGNKIVSYNGTGGGGGDNPSTPDGPGADGVYTVASALKAINSGNIPSGNVQVRGLISEITEVNTSFGNATYMIKDNLSDAAGLTIYRGYYLNGDKFTSENQLQVGATVVVEGELIMYGGNKPEMAQGNKIVSYNGTGGGGGDTPVTPPTPSGDYKGDFNSFNKGVAKASPYGTYTNATGWTLTNGIVLGGSNSGDNNPNFEFIGAPGTLAPTLNGKVGAVGTLVSPTLPGGIGTLTFNYGFAFAETKCSFTITVKGADGSVVKTDTVTLDSLTQKHAYTYSLDVNYTGNFTIEIVNNALSASTSNKDRVSIWNLTWTN